MKKLLARGMRVALCAGLVAASPASVAQPGSVVRLSPANGAVDVNPDTLLAITFLGVPTLGTRGTVRIHDADDGTLVDTLDIGIPAGPDPRRRRAPGDPPDTQAYQRYTIGGIEGVHAHPVIVSGRVATLYPHHGVLKYNRRYVVRIDPGVFNTPQGFSGFPTDRPWRFSTKRAPPAADATELVVAADGSGDFDTVQGAIDFVPDRPAQHVTVHLRRGLYEALVFMRGKSRLTLRGEDREGVQVGYGNNSAFNPPEPGQPNRRPAFAIFDSTDIQLSNFTINNHLVGQAEALLIGGARNILERMTLNGSGDALQIRGSLYVTDSRLTGHGDTILSVGPAFFERTEIHSIGPFAWIRNPPGNRGHVFKDCRFVAIDEPLPWTRTAEGGGQRVPAVLARLPNNNGSNYPHATMVLIDSRLAGISPQGWGPVEDAATFDRSHVRFWEFNSTDLSGRALDMTQRHPVSRRLVRPADAQLIDDYSRPEFVLDGWLPVVR